MIILAVPIVCWFLLILTMGILATVGVDVKEFDTVGMFFVYLQIATVILVIRWLKRRRSNVQSSALR
jgi:membrane protein DedA with SNARE-associated domain